MPDGPYTGAPVTLKLPTPLDPATLNIWGRQLNEQGFAPLTATINSIIRYLNGDSTPVVPIVPPVVAVAAPSSGDVITGTFAIAARLHVTVALAGVTAYIGDTKVADLTPTDSASWTGPGVDSSPFVDGVYTLTIRAIDQMANVGSDTVTITIRNTLISTTALLTETGIAIATEAGDELAFDVNGTPTTVPPVTATDALLGSDGTALLLETGEELALDYTTSPTPAPDTSLRTEAGDGLTTETGEPLTTDPA